MNANFSQLSAKQKAVVKAAPNSRKAALTRQYLSRAGGASNGNQPRRSAQVALPRLLPPAAPPLRRARAPNGNGNGGGNISAIQAARMWDPLHKSPIPTAVSDGHAQVTSGMVRQSFQLVPSSATLAEGVFKPFRAMLLISTSGRSGNVGVLVTQDADPTNPIKWKNFVLPTLNGAAITGNGPTAGRAMKVGVSIINTTPQRRCGGPVATLNATQRIVWPSTTQTNLSTAQFLELFQQISSQQQSRMCTGQTFMEAKSMFCHSTNDTEYITFRPWEAASSTTEPFYYGSGSTEAEKDTEIFLESISTATPTADTDDTSKRYPSYFDLKPRPMTTLCYCFDDPAEYQNYTFTARASFYTRWPMDHVLGQVHPPIPTAPVGILNMIKNGGEAFGNELHEAGTVIGSVLNPLLTMFSHGRRAQQAIGAMSGYAPLPALGNAPLLVD